MDQANHHRMNQTYHLLALCARAEGHPRFYEQLSHQVEQFTAWDELPAQAELHGMAPLLWHHFRQASINLPYETERILRGLYLRHRALNQAHATSLIEIQNLFSQAGIRALVLKGLALAYQCYPDPALRPVSDIDLLLKKNDVLPALQVLADAGYRVSFPEPGLSVLPKELIADSPLRDGVSTHVELHHYDPKHRLINKLGRDDEFKGLNEPQQELVIKDCTVYIPSIMDVLHYLMRHMIRHLFPAHPGKPLPLKWCADILSLVEQHAKVIDWVKIRQTQPAFLNRLALLYSFTPLPAKYEEIIPIKKINPPTGVNQYLHGWPCQAFSRRRVSLWQFTRLTFQAPSAWWLYLYYGIEEREIFWYGQVVHRLQILRLLVWAILRRKLFKWL